jgi:hypothetical protein
MGQSGEVHVHIHQTNHVQALDSEGMDRVLDAHKDRLAQHFNDHVRKMNG